MFPHSELAEFYGTSELSFVSVRRQDTHAPQKSVGRPFSSVQVTVRDENGILLPPGEKGRLFVESDFLFDGYLKEENGIHRIGRAISVGDIGWLDGDGFLFLEGRENRMIVSAGKNVFPEAIETILLEHPSIERALIIGVPHEVRGEALVALVTLKFNNVVSARDLRRHLARSIPRSLIPKYFVQPFQWRWTRAGKSDVNALAQDVRENKCSYLK
jgi:long-chain acyl-CoA synthetase